MKIALIAEYQRETRSISTFHIAAAIRATFPEAEFIFLESRWNVFEEIISPQTFINIEADYIGFSLYGISRQQKTIQLAKQIHAKHPNTVIFAGGPQAFVQGKGLLESEDFSFIVIGEGETAVVSALKRLENKETIDNLPGVMTRNNLFPETVIENLSNLPSPILMGLVPEELRGEKVRLPYTDTLTREGIDNRDHVLFWEIGRGCAFNCAYCMEKKTGVRRLSLERIRDELKYIATELPGIQVLRVIDSTFSHDPERLEILLNLFYEIAPNMLYVITIRPEHITDKFVELASRIHLSVRMGIQSLNNDVLKLVHRPPIDKVDFAKKMQRLRDAGVYFGYDIILGLPGETPEGYKEGINFLLTQGFSIDIGALRILPGTEFYDKAEEYQLEYYRPTLENIAASRVYYTYRTPTFASEDFTTLLKWSSNRIAAAQKQAGVRLYDYQILEPRHT